MPYKIKVDYILANTIAQVDVLNEMADNGGSMEAEEMHGMIDDRILKRWQEIQEMDEDRLGALRATVANNEELMALSKNHSDFITNVASHSDEFLRALFDLNALEEIK